MKALSMTQPWAELVVRGLKEYETRSWPCWYKGPLAIHASKAFPCWAKQLLREDGPIIEALNCPPEELHTGAVVGFVYLMRCSHTEVVLADKDISKREQAFGDWDISDGPRYVWQFRDPVKLQTPIPVKGALGLWNLSDELVMEYTHD